MKSLKPTLLLILSLTFISSTAQRNSNKANQKKRKQTELKANEQFDERNFSALKWRNIGPFRGGRSVAATGVLGDPLSYYFGSVGGGVWKTEDAGIGWRNISDGYFKSGSVGAIAVAPSDQNVIYVGMGEHAVRGVMTAHGDGVYKSTDAGKSWKHVGLKDSRTIAAVRIDPQNPDIVFVAVQGDVWSSSEERGIYKSEDGGDSWENILYVDESTGASDLSMDASNPRILYAAMWDHQRLPWQIRSGGEGSAIYKSTDSGESWEKLGKGLPDVMGKIGIDVSPADPSRVYANIEAEGEKGGVYRSDDSGQTWRQVCKDRITVARAWYYMEIIADPNDKETVYVLNAPFLKSIDGGRSFQPIPNPHSDQHDLWINPENPQNMILANDGGATISFNGGRSWSTQRNQPTAQFYRVTTDNQFPYHIYGGQQDNSTVCISSRTNSGGIGEADWYDVAGGESAFIAFSNPDDPQVTYGTSIQGFIDSHDRTTRMKKDIQAFPSLKLGSVTKDQKYRFNWNNPIINNQVDSQIIYHGANVLLRSENGGFEWKEISKDLTRNDTSKQVNSGVPFTNEGAGGEVYNTISYMASSPHEKGVIWVGSDDGLVHLTMDEGENWSNVSPPIEGESLINAIEVSPHDKATAFLAVTRYKFGDLRPMIFVTRDYGKSWESIIDGLPSDNFVRVVREDPRKPGLLYAGTEGGLYVSFNGGKMWHSFQSNLPVVPVTDLIVKDNDLIAATSGRAFWILDDLGSLQQSMGSQDSTYVHLYSPKISYKYSLAGGFEKSGTVGQNPLPGITVDYYLPYNVNDSVELKLDILSSENELIRSLSGQKPENFRSWKGGPPPPKTLPAKPGLNRINWDLRRENIEGIEGVLSFAGYGGSSVGPGIYTLQLTYGDQTAEQEVEILPDPRLTATEADFELQQQMLGQIETCIRDIHNSVNQLRSVKSQLQSRLDLMEGKEDYGDLIKTGKGAMKSINSWESELIQAKQSTFQDVINFENQLDAELLYLRSVVDSYDPRQTESVKSRLKEVLKVWDVKKKEMENIISKDLGNFNRQYRDSDLPALIVPEI